MQISLLNAKKYGKLGPSLAADVCNTLMTQANVTTSFFLIETLSLTTSSGLPQTFPRLPLNFRIFRVRIVRFLTYEQIFIGIVHSPSPPKPHPHSNNQHLVNQSI
jgi:hypothetical protein